MLLKTDNQWFPHQTAAKSNVLRILHKTLTTLTTIVRFISITLQETRTTHRTHLGQPHLQVHVNKAEVCYSHSFSQSFEFFQILC